MCRRAPRQKKLWDKTDNLEWVHDKFDVDPQDDDYMVSSSIFFCEHLNEFKKSSFVTLLA